MISKQAIIEKGAKIADNVTIGPWTYIGADVEIDEGTWIGPQVVIKGPARIGKHNKIYQFASVGEITQDKKYQGEKTYLQIGDHNTIRECCTINRGYLTDGEEGTLIGNHNLIMAYSHIAHDCHVGNHTIFSNYTGLAGHVKVRDYVILSGFVGVHQFCEIGAYSFVGAGARIGMDVLPYLLVAEAGTNPSPFGLNKIGLKRHGLADDTIKYLDKAYKLIYRSNLKKEQAIIEVEKLVADCKEVQLFVDGLKSSTRGILR